ncbi:MAG TPA: class I SAM-dependent methyltransferase [Anaerolineaceae bacterium]|nr:class I SAM-dependent methyltransferase [Anaerolineaceae bacterium]HQH86185.1 class I SAM-dependent methyltransferase [Anaerolineaceae bacterium]
MGIHEMGKDKIEIIRRRTMKDFAWNPLRSFDIQGGLNNLTDDEWLDYLLHEIEIPQQYKDIIPQMPPEAVQRHYTGSTGRYTLMESLDFFKLAQKHIAEQKIKNQAQKKLLDFGCGWGRITRMWLKSIPGKNIFAVDPVDEMIDLCKKSIPHVNFFISNPAPPLSYFQEDMFTFVTAYSVFSHLSEQYLNLWFKEFARVMAKDALLFATTRSRSFITHFQSVRNKNEYPDYANGQRQCFSDAVTALEEYDNGHILHQPMGGESFSHPYYGETCIPAPYFSRFNTDFEILEFIPELPYETNQACIILKKK